jgi:hypothetical protein
MGKRQWRQLSPPKQRRKFCFGGKFVLAPKKKTLKALQWPGIMASCCTHAFFWQHVRANIHTPSHFQAAISRPVQASKSCTDMNLNNPGA